jgi:hypothetical protein
MSKSVGEAFARGLEAWRFGVSRRRELPSQAISGHMTVNPKSPSAPAAKSVSVAKIKGFTHVRQDFYAKGYRSCNSSWARSVSSVPMRDAHYFFVDDAGIFAANLAARRYSRSHTEDNSEKFVAYSKTFSNAIVKSYSFNQKEADTPPVRIRVSYRLTHQGHPLSALAKKLKLLNAHYRSSLPEWKTKRKAPKEVREKRWHAVQKFLHEHSELISCFKYQADDRLTEGNHSFNLLIASTPREQAICLDFIKALVDAYAPHGIIRARREPDAPSKQRNGWIKRYAELHRRKGWTPLEISREIQRELREGTWNERSRLQYNLAPNTICRIAGMKLHSPISTMN